MAVKQLAEPNNAVQQVEIYNRNLGGNLKGSSSFTIPDNPQISWAVLGLILADAATPASLAATIPDIEALAEVTSVEGDQIFGKAPTTIEDPARETVVYTSSSYSATMHSGGDAFSEVRRASASVKPPVNKNWAIMIVRVPSPLDGAGITALEAAVTTIAGVTSTHHQLSGESETDQQGDGTLQIEVHMRLDPIPV